MEMVSGKGDIRKMPRKNTIENWSFSSPQELFQYAFDTYVQPDLMQRASDGRLPEGTPIKAIRILFLSDSDAVRVLLNEEVGPITGKVKLKDGIRKDKGEPILKSEIENMVVEVPELEDRDCSHITMIYGMDGWTIAFDTVYNKEYVINSLSKSKEFSSGAKYALELEQWASFNENAFAAGELAAKVLLLTYGDPDFKSKQPQHNTIHSKFNRIQDEKPFNDVLGKLKKNRKRARYSNEPFVLLKEVAESMLGDVDDIIKSVESRIARS